MHKYGTLWRRPLVVLVVIDYCMHPSGPRTRLTRARRGTLLDGPGDDCSDNIPTLDGWRRLDARVVGNEHGCGVGRSRNG